MQSVTGSDKILIDFDHLSEHHSANTRQVHDRLLSESPIGWTEANGGHWVVSSHDLARKVFSDWATFSSEKWKDDQGHWEGGVQIPTEQFYYAMPPSELAPPEWGECRAVLAPYFSKQAAEAWRPRVQKLADDLIDGFIGEGKCELMHDLVNAVPAMVTLLQVGSPEDMNWHDLAQPFHDIEGFNPGTPEHAAAGEKLAELMPWIASLVAARRANPNQGEQDILDLALLATWHGEPATDEYATAIVYQMILAGVETTSALMGNVFEYLDGDLETRRDLREHPEKINLAIEEFQRYSSTVQAEARTIMADIEIGGQQLTKGERILIEIGAANHDEAVFSEPYSFKIDRYPNPHLGWGAGIHKCLGQNLARVIVDVVVETVLNRLPDYKIDRAGARPFPRRNVITGWLELPITF